ncbi:MAG: copper homeostasis protein CutC, partial [Bacteroidota bacterium]
MEICIEAVGDAGTYHAVASALRGGADSVELCGEMHADGLTPPLSSIRAARRAFGDRGSLRTMVRPRAGDFEFSDDELAEMEAQVRL